VHLVALITEIYYDARPCERQIDFFCFKSRNSLRQFILKHHQFRDTEEKLLILFIVYINESSVCGKNLEYFCITLKIIPVY